MPFARIRGVAAADAAASDVDVDGSHQHVNWPSCEPDRVDRGVHPSSHPDHWQGVKNRATARTNRSCSPPCGMWMRDVPCYAPLRSVLQHLPARSGGD